MIRQKPEFLYWFAMTIYKTTKDSGTNMSIKTEIENWDTQAWLHFSDAAVPQEFKDLPNYKAAQDIKKSGLYKAMKEEE